MKARMQRGFWRIWGKRKAVKDSAFSSPLSAPSSARLLPSLSLFLNLHNRPQPWNMSITTWIPWKEALLEAQFQTSQRGAEFLSGSMRCPLLAENLPWGRKGWKQVPSPILQNGSGTCHGKWEGEPSGSLITVSLNAEWPSLANVLPSSEAVFFFIFPQEKYPTKYSQKGHSWSPKLCVHFQSFSLGVRNMVQWPESCGPKYRSWNSTNWLCEQGWGTTSTDFSFWSEKWGLGKIQWYYLLEALHPVPGTW